MPSQYIANDWLAAHHTCCNCGGKFIAGLHKATHSRKHRGRYMHANCFDAKRQATDHAAGITCEPPQGTQPDTEPFVQDVPEPQPAPVTATATDGNPMAVLAAAIAPYIKVDSATIEAMVQQMQDAIATFDVKTTETLEDAKAAIAQLVAKEVANATRIVKFQTITGEVRTIENAHMQMPDLMYLVSKRKYVYLCGLPGVGKSFAPEQLAETLGMRYGYLPCEPQTPPSKLLGFIAAGGNYVRTMFRDCFEHGGIFLCDEPDNAQDSMLTALNGALAGRYGSFPDGMVKKHPDFVCILAGNTNGRGPTKAFPTRRRLDVAFMDRYSFIEWQLDEKLTRAITLGINPDALSWFNWVMAAHKAALSLGEFITPRAAFDGADYLLDSGKDAREIAEMVAFKGMAKDTVDSILRIAPLPTLRAKSVNQ